jgi:hypothetical protein
MRHDHYPSVHFLLISVFLLLGCNNTKEAVSDGAQADATRHDSARGDLANSDTSTRDSGGSDGSEAVRFSVEWAKGFGGTVFDYPRSIAVNSAGDVFVTGDFEETADFGGGSLTSAGQGDIFLASYTAGGGYLSSKRWGKDAMDQGRAVAVDASGNLYMCGKYSRAHDFGCGALPESIGSTIFLVSFSPDGQCRWSKHFEGWANTLCEDLVVDGSGNIYITGYFDSYATGSHNYAPNFGGGSKTSNGDLDIFVASYTSDGAYRWANVYGGDNDDAAEAIAVSGDGATVVVTGYFRETVDLGQGPVTADWYYDLFVMSFKSSGEQNWAKPFGGEGTDWGEAVALDPAGNVYVAGKFGSTVDFGGGSRKAVGETDIILASYTPDGVHRWSKAFGDSGQDWPSSVRVDGRGNVIMAGHFDGTVDFGDGPLTGVGGNSFLASFSSSGSLLGATRFDAENIIDVDIDSANDIYLTGSYRIPVDFGGTLLEHHGGTDIFLVKVSR